ncbi:MAG: hypothetical protein KatS3mg003_0667 [Candidatus Nitrosocaldaceae archaeon]|nr:MAG: hypothetical protein KatS3mg003_0667 [Candidatus Nitrosocaldaceae archaeon]
MSTFKKYFVLMLLGPILNILLSLFSYIISKNQFLILLGSYNTFAGNTKTFYIYLHKHKIAYDFYWITGNKYIYNLLKSNRLPVLYLYSFRAFIYILRANYLLLTHGPIDVSYFYFLLGRFNMIQTWHGIPLKQISRNAMKATFILRIVNRLSRICDQCYKLILATSIETKQIFMSAFMNNNVEIIGYPRNDVLFNENIYLRFEDYNKKFSLYNYNKVILYCPTFRERPTKKPFTDNFLEILNKYLVNNNIIMLIKKHPYDKHINIAKYSNIIDISNDVIDLQDLLINVDILITDYSSVMFDFVLLDRPIIFYPYDINEYIKDCRGLYYDYFKEVPGPFAYDEQELLYLISNIYDLFNNNDYILRYQKFKDKFHYYKDGRSCERLLQFLTRQKL